MPTDWVDVPRGCKGVTVTSPPPDTSAESGRTRVDLTKAGAGPGWRRYLTALGPGLVTGASDDDPSGIATYAQTGAQTGLSFAWTALLTYPLMAAVQEICDRTALATGKGLGEHFGVLAGDRPQ